MDRDICLETIINSYQAMFNVYSPHELCARPLAAYCFFSSRSEKYVLIKRAVIWAADSFEHVVVLDIPRLTVESLNDVSAYLAQLEKALVQPNRDHMYSFLTMILLCEEVEPAAKKRLQRIRFTRNYRFSWHGYSSGRIVVINLAENDIFSNTAGKPVAQFYQKKLANLV